jgi:hypothetical protein
VLVCLRAGKRSLLDGLEGRKSVKLVVAIYQAASTRKEVRLRYIFDRIPLGQEPPR